MEIGKEVLDKPLADKLMKIEGEVRGVAFKTAASFVLREADHEFLLTW